MDEEAVVILAYRRVIEVFPDVFDEIMLPVDCDVKGGGLERAAVLGIGCAISVLDVDNVVGLWSFCEASASLLRFDMILNMIGTRI